MWTAWRRGGLDRGKCVLGDAGSGEQKGHRRATCIGRARRKKDITGGGNFTSFIIIDAKYCDCLTIGSAYSFACLAPTPPMNALSLAPRALYQEVAELLRQRIFSRDLEPGSWIDELKIAEAYGISRTPLREALKVLAAEGLVTMKVRRGAYVTEVSDKDLTDVYHLLALLESDGAAVVAERATDEQLAELRELHAELEAAVLQRDRFFVLNEQFHLRLLEIADNRWRQQMVSDLRKVMKLNRHNSLLKTGRINESLAEHRAVMQALLARNTALTRERMQQHFQNGLEAAT